MGKTLWKDFYISWFKTIFRYKDTWHSPWTISAGAATAISIIIQAVAHWFPKAGKMMGDLSWEIPIWIFAALGFLRFLLSPYWLYRDSEKDAQDSLGKQTALLEQNNQELARLQKTYAELNERVVSEKSQIRESEKPKPALTFVHPRRIRVDTEVRHYAEDYYRFMETDCQDKPFGLLATFRNDGTIPVNDVKVQLRYKDARDNEIGDSVFGAYWIDKNSYGLDFNVGQAHSVLVGIVSEKSRVTPWMRPKPLFEGQETIENLFHTWDNETAKIEIRLFDKNSQSLVKPVSLRVTQDNNGVPTLVHATT